MSWYRVVCTEQTGCSRGGHIKSVGTGDPDAANASWTVQEVWDMLDRGHVFYTQANGYTATVEKYRCGCGWGSLRSSADATTANNLDSLRLCRWKAA
jgi:hypothetical protein